MAVKLNTASILFLLLGDLLVLVVLLHALQQMLHVLRKIARIHKTGIAHLVYLHDKQFIINPIVCSVAHTIQFDQLKLIESTFHVSVNQL